MTPERLEKLRVWLDPVVARFEQPAFIVDDPISVPHAFDDPADQEIIGLFAALLAWGRRDIMLAKLGDLCERMEYRPHAFIRTLSPSSQALKGFVHRTFNQDDALGLALSVQSTLTDHGSLEGLFRTAWGHTRALDSALEQFSGSLLASIPGRPKRMNRHIARPSTGSACKRLVMYLRWMIRPGPVDLACWDVMGAEHLALPLDVHSGRQARSAGLLSRKSNDWKAVMELTDVCRLLRPHDPAAYDFALFGTGSAGENLQSSSSDVSAT